MERNNIERNTRLPDKTQTDFDFSFHFRRMLRLVTSRSLITTTFRLARGGTGRPRKEKQALESEKPKELTLEQMDKGMDKYCVSETLLFQLTQVLFHMFHI